MHIQFLGATKTVTGSKNLISASDKNLLVDCGLFQGRKELRLRNRDPLPTAPTNIDNVLLTHAHIDHSGYIPLLVKNGFSGNIYCTKATKDLCSILLPDSGYIQEEEANYANRKGYSKHYPAKPLYTKEDAERAITYFSTKPFASPFKVSDQFSVTFHYAGHILGAASTELAYKDTSILFSGDLGRDTDPIMYPPHTPPLVDYVVIESTYGDRVHPSTDPMELMSQIINKTVDRHGSIIIPAFAVGRAQALLYYLYQLKQKNKIPDIPVYLDSPLATNATKLFYQHIKEHRFSKSKSADVCMTAKYINDTESSKALDNQEGSKIIISASGMATGGRILHHLKYFAPDPRNTILFTGFQAENTRGDRILKGEKQVKMLGVYVPIRAEVVELDSLSAHADSEGLLHWLSKLPVPPKNIFITHGEEASAKALRDKIQAQFQWPCTIPNHLERFQLKG